MEDWKNELETFVKADHVEGVKRLLEGRSGYPAHLVRSVFRTCVFQAFMNESLGVLKVLMDNDLFDASEPQFYNGQPLAFMCTGHFERRKGTASLAVVLDHPKIDLKIEDRFGNRIFAVACQNGSPLAVRYLLERTDLGIDYTSPNLAEMAPLELAVVDNQLEVIRVLLEARETVDLAERFRVLGRGSILFVAVGEVHDDTVQVLLDSRDWDLTERDAKGYTLLHQALKNRSEVVKLLLDLKEVPVCAPPDQKLSLLQWFLASGEGEPETLQILLGDPRIDPAEKGLEKTIKLAIRATGGPEEHLYLEYLLADPRVYRKSTMTLAKKTTASYLPLFIDETPGKLAVFLKAVKIDEAELKTFRNQLQVPIKIKKVVDEHLSRTKQA